MINTLRVLMEKQISWKNLAIISYKAGWEIKFLVGMHHFLHLRSHRLSDYTNQMGHSDAGLICISFVNRKVESCLFGICVQMNFLEDVLR